MAEKLIPFGQALQLTIYMKSLAEVNAITQMAGQRLERLRVPLAGYAEIAGVPLDRADLVVDITDGPDKKGMVKVTWKEDDDGRPTSS